MKKLKAYWLQFWHCILNTADAANHRPVDEIIKGKVVYIGCECGKRFYGKPVLSTEEFNNLMERMKKEFEKK